MKLTRKQMIMISFMLFDAASMTDFIRNVGNLFNFANLAGAETLYYLRSYAVLLGMALIGCTDYPKRAVLRLAEKTETAPVMQMLTPVFVTGMQIVCTAYLVDGSFNPFLYFRF